MKLYKIRFSQSLFFSVVILETNINIVSNLKKQYVKVKKIKSAFTVQPMISKFR